MTSELGSIQFDKMVVNTDLAQEYFKLKSNEFHSITESKEPEFSKESDGHNTIHTISGAAFAFRYLAKEKPSFEQCNVIHENLLKLAKLVEDNAELFGQIEHMMRKIPIDEVENYDIKLIVQNLTCRSYVTTESYVLNCLSINCKANGIMMNADSPLANLGYVTQLLMNLEKVYIFATKETAAACYLFTELCRKVGLDSVNLILLAEEELPKLRVYDMNTIPALMNGCVGVITEKSDIDSAVDELLKTTTKYPWKLTRIYVQESTYDRFKKVMKWKTEKVTIKPDQPDTVGRLCDDTYVYDGKTFLIDYAGPSISNNRGIVLVEAFRTIKELIALINNYKPFYMSVWASDLSEANEIAYKVSSSIVWINSYGILAGPSNCAEEIYKCSLDDSMYVNFYKKDLLAQQIKWSKKTFDERRRTLYAAVAKILNDEEDENGPVWEELMLFLRDLKCDDFVCVEDGRICTGISLPNDIVYLHFKEWNSLYIAKLLTSGAALVHESGDHCLRIISEICPDLPICHGYTGNERKKDNKVLQPYANRIKVVWTNFGTIFAN